jgi:hypothetical protein
MASLDSQADRIVADVRQMVEEISAPPPAPEPQRKVPYPWLAAIVAALIPGIVLAIFYIRMQETNQSLAAQVRRLEDANAALVQSNADLEARLERQARAETEAAATGTTEPNGSASIAASRIELVPYGEIPLAGTRVEVLRALIGELQEQSFRGVVEVRLSVGRFCLSGSQQEGYALAPPDLPATRCDLVGNPFADALAPAQQQSVAYANLVGSLRRDADAPLRVEIAPGTHDPAVAYPVSAADVTAGAWNQVAARNNRVEFRAVAAQ